MNDVKKEDSIFWKFAKSTGGKISVIVGLIVGLQFLIPWAREIIIGDKIENSNQEVYDYIDQKLDENKTEADEWLVYFLDEVERIDDRYSQDSLKADKRNQWHAVGLRADDSGTLKYRDRYGNQFPIRADVAQQRYMFKAKDNQWYWCYFEEY